MITQLSVPGDINKNFLQAYGNMSLLSDFSFLDVIFDKDETIKLEEDIQTESKDDESVVSFKNIKCCHLQTKFFFLSHLYFKLIQVIFLNAIINNFPHKSEFFFS